MAMSKRNTMSSQQGFTLVELVIVIMLLGIIAAVGSQVLASAFRGYFLGRDLAEADWQGRLALARMSREIRDIPTPADLTTMNATQISFNDINASAITYILAGTSLQRNGVVLADDVTSLTFTYLDANLATTAVAAEVRHIAIGLNVSRGGGNMALRTTVTNRNLQ